MMTYRCFFALVALSATALNSEAGPFRRNAQPTYQYPSCQYPTSSYPTYQYPTYQSSAWQYPAYQQPLSWVPVVPAGGVTSNYTPVVSAGFGQVAPAGVGDGLDEVNAKRASRGLRPFVRDAALTQAAQACAAQRAQYGMFGHTSNDFGFLPPGATAASTGCAAYPASYGWMSCCTYENYTFAGAAWVTGRDGRRYMHLFVR
jgi:hypothetical protein